MKKIEKRNYLKKMVKWSDEYSDRISVNMCVVKCDNPNYPYACVSEEKVRELFSEDEVVHRSTRKRNYTNKKR